MKAMRWFPLVALASFLLLSTTGAMAADIGLSKDVVPHNPNVYHLGDTIHYKMIVRNIAAAESITVNEVTDELPDGTTLLLDSSYDSSFPALPYTLAAGDTQVYYVDWVAVPVRYDPVVNTLHCVGIQHSAVPDEFNASVTKTSLISKPCIDVTKEVDCDISKVGDEVVYHICITNCGNVALSNVSVVDDVIGDISGYFPASLAVDQTACADIHYTIQEGDPDPLVNTVTASGQDIIGLTVSDFATESVDLIHPCLDVDVECLSGPVPEGCPAEFLITVTNCGDCILVTDVPEGDPVLDPGEDVQWTETLPTEIGDEDVCYGLTVNWSLPAEYCDLPNTGSAGDEACCDVVPTCLEVTKVADCDISKAGDEVVYHVCVTNCGEADLYSLSVIDDVMGDVSGYFPSGLPAGDTECADIPYTVQESDADPLINTVTATAMDACDRVLTANATEEVDLIHPCLEVDVECLSGPVAAGCPAEFLVTATNCGDCGLVINTAPARPPVLNPGETAQWTESVATEIGDEEVCHDVTVNWSLPAEYCEMTNTGSATDGDCCAVDPTCLRVTKVADCGISKVGDEVVYHICVTNCGEADLYDLSVVDDVMGDISGYYPSGLAPGDSACADVAYVVQGGDPDPLINTVTATAFNECGGVLTATATEEVDLIHPCLEGSAECQSGPVPEGCGAEFLVSVTNCGDCILDISSDPPIPDLPGRDRGDTDTEAGFSAAQPGNTVHIMVSPGETFNWEATVPYPGPGDEICYEATVTWTLPPEYCGMTNSGSIDVDACCDVVPPCIEVTKEVDCDISSIGDEVVYHICVTNCGSTDLFYLEVSDDVLGDLSYLFPDELPAGEFSCMDVSYTVQAEDPDPLVNTVTVNAENVCGTSVSAYAEETVDLVHPDLSIYVECLTEPVTPGGDADFLCGFTNTGDCDLNVTTDMPELPGPWRIAPGSHTITVTRPDPGGVDCVYHGMSVVWTVPDDYCEIADSDTLFADACCHIAGEQGCTPGFWKNHPACWCEDYAPDDLLGDVFGVPSQLSGFADDTLMEGLNYGGGSGVEGAARNLFRSAVAALQNACNDNIAYPLGASSIIAEVNEALASLDRNTILDLHGMLDSYNNYGCPIDAHCRPHGDIDKSLSEDHTTSEIVKPGTEKDVVPTVAASWSDPNPFRENTTITFQLPKSGNVTIDVFDVAGRRVANLMNSDWPAGSHTLIWDGRNSDGIRVPGGVYFYRISLGDETLTRKMLIVR